VQRIIANLLVRNTYSLDDLEKNYTQEAINLGTFLVCASHLRLHPFSESARGLESARNDEDARKEEPKMRMVGRERVRAVFAVVLRDDFNDREDERYQRVLEDLGPCTLVIVSLDPCAFE
jgi:hypothetical protein